VLAERFGALTIEPEHRYYGTSMPFGDQSLQPDNMYLLNPQQALADAANFIVGIQKEYGCTARDTNGYCPVITVGGSYPGFLSAMMRLRYPEVVDIGYAASAPVLFYAQEVDQSAYYKIITSSAERAIKGCAAAVRYAMTLLLTTPVEEVVSQLNICTPLPIYMQANDTLFYEELAMVIMVQFANMNMGNYPPNNSTDLYKACASFTQSDAWTALRALLASMSPALADSRHRGRTPPRRAVSLGSYRLAARLGGVAVSVDGGAPALSPLSCFDFTSQTPAGPNGTVTCGDWSGCGGGLDGESWDYETCGFLVEQIGTNNVTDMFPPRQWTFDWLDQHCRDRFGITPQPRYLADLWGFDHLVEVGATRIIFTNGLNDGWSAGGFPADLSPELRVFSMPNGAHHSDLSHSMPSSSDTPDVVATRAAIADLIQLWLTEVKMGPA